jgi:hypothetical protein
MFHLKNDGVYVEYSTININFDRCDKNLNPNCKSENEIDKFFSDFTIQLWSYNDFMDFDMYD